MKTTEEVKVLVAAINTGKVSDEQVVACKEVALQAMTKVLSGETVSADEVLVNKYVSTLLSKAVANAGKFAETEANKAKAEAEYKQALQAHKLEVNNLYGEFVTRAIVTNKKGESKLANEFENRDAVKTHFDAFIKSLPAAPKKPNMSGTGRTGSNEYSNPKPVANIVEGSTNWHIKTILEGAADGLTKKELFAALKLASADKSETTLTLTIAKALNGRLPQITQTGDKLFWTPEPEVELEVVTPEPEK